jgi:hypothetical protein
MRGFWRHRRVCLEACRLSPSGSGSVRLPRGRQTGAAAAPQTESLQTQSGGTHRWRFLRRHRGARYPTRLQTIRDQDCSISHGKPERMLPRELEKSTNGDRAALMPASTDNAQFYLITSTKFCPLLSHK